MSKGIAVFDAAEMLHAVQSTSIDYNTTQNALQIAAAKTGLKVVVLGVLLGASGGAWTFQFNSDTTALTGNIPLADGGSIDKTRPGEFPVKTAVGEALKMDLVRTGGDLDGVIFWAYTRK